ncbi:MAG TPA: bifunctional glutamate N-acetyltransferase/amino-acid acetyltransferase ArgJ [Acidimicrobiales bacterium]|nr:bifunctional glutamate N-acetyltransferase/amino-acid acetyltransferase ArgJ [Acidimicrobiales bacterium]
MTVTAVDGFVAAGIACGIKESGAPDLALVATADGQPVPAAAVFTANKAKAAPVQVTAAHLAATGGRAAAVVLNSGNANAATGDDGRAKAQRTAELVADELGCLADHVLVCSTGLIGIPLPLEPVEKGVAPLVAARTPDGGPDAARAMMTTDTHPKQALAAAGGITVGGIAKGAAMLAPDMATMLAVLTTDAAVEPDTLHALLRRAVAASFNTLTVDGCTSTNDTVIVLANGRSGVDDDGALQQALTEACSDLAAQMAGDAEGATKVVTVTVSGAASDADAAAAARKVAQSQLVKCSFYGQDPYWGRVVSELGTSGAAFDPDRVAVAYGGVAVCVGGIAAPHDEAAVKAHLAERHVRLDCDLGLGEGTATVLTNDLTHAYIDENMRTS